MKTVLGREKTAAVKRTFRKTFKREKIDVDEKKKYCCKYRKKH